MKKTKNLIAFGVAILLFASGAYANKTVTDLEVSVSNLVSCIERTEAVSFAEACKAENSLYKLALKTADLTLASSKANAATRKAAKATRDAAYTVLINCFKRHMGKKWYEKFGSGLVDVVKGIFKVEVKIEKKVSFFDKPCQPNEPLCDPIEAFDPNFGVDSDE